MSQTANAQLLYNRKSLREQRPQKQPESLQFPDPQDSQADEATIEVKSQTSNVITAGFVETLDSK